MRSLFGFALLLLSVSCISQPVNQTFQSPGSHTYVVPVGYAANLLVRAWGGGGGGGATTNAGGGGGGGGYSTHSYSAVGPGSYAIVVGSGGNPGINGTASSYDFAGLIIAGGGNAAPSNGQGGVGGVGTFSNGGSGGNRGNPNGAGGGGGGSGPTATNGANGMNGIGGAGGFAGGGNGGNTGANGVKGLAGGGGGGGKGDGTTTSGVGAEGRVEVIVQLVLPVELISFNATMEGRNILLSWQTATEINSDYFAIEHSQSGHEWTQLHMVPAAGHSVQRRNYAYSHTPIKTGIQYYRLRMVDLDGTYEYSPTVAAQIHTDQESNVKSWKANGQIFIDGIENPAGGQLSLYNTAGQQLQSASIQPGILTPGLTLTESLNGIGIIIWQPENGTPVAVKVY